MRWVNLTTVTDIYQAQFIEQALQDEGIKCMIVNENASTLMPYATYSGITIQLRVIEADIEVANEVLEKLKAKTDEIHCPNCDSTNVKYGVGGKKANLFMLVSSALFGALVSKYHLSYSCNDCGAEFRKEKI